MINKSLHNKRHLDLEVEQSWPGRVKEEHSECSGKKGRAYFRNLQVPCITGGQGIGGDWRDQQSKLMRPAIP
jgi:hypothetical protein